MSRRGQFGWLGVDIGQSAIKFAQVRRRALGYELVDAKIIPRPTSDASVSLADGVRQALNAGIMFRGRRAAASLPMQVCHAVSVTTNGAADDEARSLIKEELDRVFPAQADELLFDYWPTETVTRQGHDALALACPPPVSDNVFSELSDAGLECMAIDGAPLALAGALTLTHDIHSDSTAILDWGRTSATLVVVKLGMPQFIRSLKNVSLVGAVEQFVDELELQEDQVWQLMREHGLPERSANDYQTLVQETLAPTIAALVGECKSTFQYLKTYQPTLAPTRVVLFGGGGQIRNLGPRLTKDLGLPTTAWQLDEVVQASNPAWREQAPSLAMAIALSTLAWEASP